MTPPRGTHGPAAVRRFLLAAPPGDGPPRLAPGEAEHALRVLRLKPGDELVGLDGQGGAWPLRYLGGTSAEPRLEVAGAVSRAPCPGTAGAPLPWIEVAAALPRGSRAEDMLDRLVQLGVSGFRPVVWERSGEEAREAGAGRLRRLERAAERACKQADRRWLPGIAPTTSVAELTERAPGRETCLLVGDAAGGLAGWTLARRGERELDPEVGTRDRPLLLVVGPEGGITATERERFSAVHATEARLGPHVLRLETAAEAAVAIVAAVWFESPV